MITCGGPNKGPPGNPYPNLINLTGKRDFIGIIKLKTEMRRLSWITWVANSRAREFPSERVKKSQQRSE